jgi:hypothetical protein
MSDTQELRNKLRERLLDDFRQEYADAVETWRALETKAQVSITVGGVFLAATFAFARDLDKLDSAQKLLLSSAIVLLVVTVLCGLAVFHVVEIQAPPLGTFAQVGVFDILKKPDGELQGYLERFSQDQATTWRSAIEGVAAANNRKADWVWRAQLSLVIAITATAAFTIYRLVQ